jgi:hypothetical protein
MKTLLFMIVCCASLFVSGCGPRMTGTYESESGSLPGQDSSKVQLTFEGRRVRINNWGGLELVVPYRVKKERVELVLQEGQGEDEPEQVLSLTINADGSLEGLPGRLVKVD